VHTAFPAIIENYDATKCKADVQPVLSATYADGSFMKMPVIPNVPIVWPRSSLGSISFPLQRGDTCLVICSEKSIDDWLSLGGVNAPSDPRAFDLNDAIAIPGLFPLVNLEHAIDATCLHIQFKDKSIKIKDNGDIELKNDKGIATLKANGQFDINNGNLTVDK
jgi:hypothetical protein